MYSPGLVIKLNDIAHEWSGRMEQAIIAVLSQSRYRNKGVALDSITVRVIEGNEKKTPEIIVEYVDYLNILNKPKAQWTSMPPIDGLEDWAETKTFDHVPGYKNGVAPNLPPWKAKLRTLWAIAITKKKYDLHKSKPWRKKSLSSVLREMNAKIKLAYNLAIEEEMVQSFNQGLHG